MFGVYGHWMDSRADMSGSRMGVFPVMAMTPSDTVIRARLTAGKPLSVPAGDRLIQ